MSDDVLSYAGAAAELDTSPRGFARLLASGDGPVSFRVGKRRMFRKADIHAWIATRTA
jgi:Helix-turn-helix domain